MKKTLLVALLASFATNAQVREKGEIEVSPFIGVSSANYYGDVGIMNEAVMRPQFGANLDLYFNDRWSFRTGLEYQSMGSQGESYGYYGFESFEEKLNLDRKSTRLNSSHVKISYAVFCVNKKKEQLGHLDW